MSRADVELPWYWGFAAKTAQGDAGLRSPLGAQLEAVRSGVHLEHCVDSSRAEDSMLRSLGGASLGRTVARRLAVQRPLHVSALRLHYDPRVSLPYGVDGCATLLTACRVLCAPDGPPTHAAARKALLATSPARREAIASQAADLVAIARLAYDSTEVQEERGVQVDDPRQWRHA